MRTLLHTPSSLPPPAHTPSSSLLSTPTQINTLPILPLLDAGATSMAYTVTTDKNKPSPTPAIHLPTKNCANFVDAHATTLPAAKTTAPNVIVLVLEILSDSGPDATEASDAVMRMDETMRP